VENGAHILNNLCGLLQSTVNKRDRNVIQDRIISKFQQPITELQILITAEITIGCPRSALGPVLFPTTEI
jgi:hypothetical protein